MRQESAHILWKAKLTSQNINREKRLALQSLKQNDYILILPADKGNATVVMDKRDYHNQVNTLLSDAQVYKKLKRDPTFSVEKKTSFLIKKQHGEPPTYQLARFLTKPLQKLTGLNDSHIRNSMDFVNKITKIKTKPNDILNTASLPLISISKENSSNKPREQQWDPPYHPSLRTSLWNTENEILKKAPLKPSTWFRYVDDTFFIWNHGRETLPQFLTFITSQHPNIQFPMEIEQNSQIPFLDVFVRRNEDGTLGHNVYRKPTHTDRNLHSISEPAALDGELNHLHRALTRNGYSSRNINRTTQKLTKKEPILNDTRMPEAEKEKKKAVVLPYLRGTTDRISRVLSKHNIRVIFKPHNKLSQMLPNPKDRRPHLAASVVYKIPCACGKVYIGETERKI
ncbi:PREDICTED: uncharacterized protein LOC105556140, partial [Vollenhovia emeryi]|uniref:uncharacterized protein LOC105556140 n=1 Tax=Vollenhovia emeryi TaxID=411798 RepID=UPI0005F45492